MLEWQWIWSFSLLPLPLLVWWLLKPKVMESEVALRVPFIQDLPRTGATEVRRSWRWLAKIAAVLA